MRVSVSAEGTLPRAEGTLPRDRARPPAGAVRGVRTLASRVAVRRERAMPLRDKAYCTAVNASSRLPICADAQPRRSHAVAIGRSTLGVTDQPV